MESADPTPPTDYPVSEFYSSSTVRSATVKPGTGSEKDRYWLHALLFLATLASTMWAGGILVGRELYYIEFGRWISFLGIQLNLSYLMDGFLFGGSLLLFLTVHEFGHYFAARYHSVSTSLPYYIPFPFNGIGTFGAVIRIRQQVPSMRKLFDIGAAGPLAGFVVAVIAVIVGLMTLPGLDYIMDLPGHEAMKAYIAANGAFPDEIILPQAGGPETVLVVGSTPLYWLITQFFTDVPPMWELYHYPVLFAGWLGLFFTALNLLPVGQLDGGHMLYALIGAKWHGRLARGFVMLLLVSGGIGFINEIGPVLSMWTSMTGPISWLILSAILLFFVHRMFFGEPRLVITALLGVVLLVALGSRDPAVVDAIGYSGWLFWCLLIVLMIKIDHPPVIEMEPLTRGRRALAILGLIIFALCFSIKPLYII